MAETLSSLKPFKDLLRSRISINSESLLGIETWVILDLIDVLDVI